MHSTVHQKYLQTFEKISLRIKLKNFFSQFAQHLNLDSGGVMNMLGD